MKHYIAEKWQDILVFNNLDTSQKIWALKAEWFEEPNYRRGGWSGVSRIELKLPEGGSMFFYLKRQEDHVSRSLRHPIKGISTFLREFNNIEAFNRHSIPSLEVLFFEAWEENGHQRAVILTKELEGYYPLSSDQFQPGGEFVATLVQRGKLFSKLAWLMQKMHANNFQHNCFYLKHIFAKPMDDGELELAVIDLEKVKQRFSKKQAVFRDLYTLNRHAKNWALKDKVRFYQDYQNERKLSPQSKKLWFDIASRIKRKSP